MAIFLHNAPLQLNEIENDLPEGFAGPFLKGSKVFYYAKNECKLIIQEIISELYTLRLNVFHFFNFITLDSISNKEGIHSRLILEGKLKHKIKGAGRIYLKEGEFTMIFAVEANCQCAFEKEIDYKTFDVFYSPQILNELSELFPEIKELRKTGKIRKLVTSPSFVTPAMKDIIRQIFDCPFDEDTRHFYIDLKVREYLFLMLEHAFNRRPSRYNYTPYEKACIIKAEKILTADISQKPLSLPMLAQACSISEYKLKEGFRQIFGASVFEYLLEARMQKARNLILETNEPLKSICVQTGYSRITNFITAFRKRFGYTPGSLRRQ